MGNPVPDEGDPQVYRRGSTRLGFNGSALRRKKGSIPQKVEEENSEKESDNRSPSHKSYKPQRNQEEEEDLRINGKKPKNNKNESSTKILNPRNKLDQIKPPSAHIDPKDKDSNAVDLYPEVEIKINENLTKDKDSGAIDLYPKTSAKTLPQNAIRPKSLNFSELEQQSRAANWVTMFTLILTVSTHGYYLTMSKVMTGPLTTHVYKLPLNEQKIATRKLVAFYALGYALGSLNLHIFTRYFGRIHSMVYLEGFKILLICFLNIPSFGALIVLKILIGLVSGLQLPIALLIGSELMPRSVFLIMGSLFYLVQRLFMLLGESIPAFFGDQYNLALNHRLVMVWPVVISFVVIGLLVRNLGMVETPDFYVENAKHGGPINGRQVFLRAMKKIYKENSARRFGRVKLHNLHQIQRIEIERSEKKNEPVNGERGLVEYLSWFNLCSKSFKTQLKVGLQLCLFRELSGNVFLPYFAGPVFQNLTQNGDQIKLIRVSSLLIGALCSPVVIKFGRRKVMLISSFIHAASLIGYIKGVISEDPLTNTVSTFFYMASFSVGLSSVLFIYIVEILPPFGVGLCLAVHMVLFPLLEPVYVDLVSKIAIQNIMLIHLFFSLCLFFTVSDHCIETKGLTKEQVQLIFMKNEEAGADFGLGTGKKGGKRSSSSSQSPSSKGNRQFKKLNSGLSGHGAGGDKFTRSQGLWLDTNKGLISETDRDRKAEK